MAEGSINQLNFEVILKDANFEARLKALQGIAEAFNTSMSNALQISKVATGTSEVTKLDKALKSAAEGAKNLNANLNALPTAKVTKFANETKNASAQMTNMKSVLRTVSQLTGAAFSVIGLRRFLSTLIDVTGQFEVQKMALRNMLQDAEAADKIFQDLYEFSSRSTYRFSELAKYSKQLAAFNISKDSLLETTKMLGDVASGVGVSMDRLILAYGHVKSSGFLRGIQLRSFSQNGVPILEELSKMFTEIEGKVVSLGDVFDKMMKREIPFEMVEEAFKRMTSEGGKFYQMQEVLAKTLAGQINILKGKWENMMYAVGQSEEGFLKGTVKALTGIVNHMDQIANALKPVILGLGAYGAALLAAAAAQKVMDLARFAKYFILLAQRTNVATAAVKVFGSATKAAAVGIGLAVTAIAAMVMVVRNTSTEVDKFKKHLDDIHKTVRDNAAYDEEISKVDSLRKILNDTNQSYDTRKAALDRLKSIVPQYHADLTEEGRLINNNTSALDAYIDALNREAKMKGAQDELTELYRERRTVLKEIEERQKEVDARNSASPAPGYIVPAGKTPLENMLTPAKLDNANEKLKVLDDTIAGINKEIAETITAGKSEADGMIYNVSSIVEGLQNIDTELDKLRTKAKKEGISVTEKEQLDALKSQREEQVKLYKDIMGVDYDKAVRAGETQQNKLVKDRISGIKAEIQLLQKYKQTYEAFENLLGEEGAKEITGKIYKNANISNFDFTSQIVELTNALRALGDEAGAESVLASLGLGEGKDIEKNLQKAQQIAKTYRNLMEAWEAKDTDAEDDTLFGKLTKVVSDLNTKSNELFLKFKKGKEMLRSIDLTDPLQKKAVIQGLMDEGMTEDAANEFWNTFVEKGETALTELYVKNLGYLKKNAQSSVNALAEGIVNGTRKGLNMKDWGDKSYGQIKGIVDKIKTLLSSENFGIDEKTIQKLKDAGISLDEFFGLIKEGYEGLLEEGIEEKQKKAARVAKYAASQFSSLADEIRELGNLKGSDTLVTVADTISGVSSAISSISAGYSAGGGWGAAIAAAVEMLKQVMQALSEAADLEIAVTKAQEQARLLNLKNKLSEGSGTVFGDNPIQKAKAAVSVMEELRTEARKLEKELNAQDIEKTYTSSILNPLPLETLLDNAQQKLFGFNANLMSRVNKDWEAYQDAIKKGYSGIEAYIVKTTDKSGFWNMLGFRDEYKSLKDLIEDLGYDLYDEYGNLNGTALQAVLDTYTKLGEEDRKWIQEAIDNAETYADAMKQVEDVMGQLFGNIASQAADTIVDSWVEAGKVALDYADIVDDVAQSYAKMVIKSMILDDVLNSEAVKAVKEAFLSGESDQAMSLIEGKLQAIADLEPVFQQVLETFDPYFKKEETERTASTKKLATNFTQDTIDYWSGQLTLLVEYARRGDEQRETITNLVLALRDSMAAGGNGDYTSNVQTYLATIQSDTTAIRGDIYAMKLAIQNMNDKGVKML